MAHKIDPLKLKIEGSSTQVCSGMDNICVANNDYFFVTVMITNFISITIKCYILITTPFDLIIGRKTILKHHLVNRFPAYFGIILHDTIDITHETDCTPPVLCQATKQKKVKAKINKKSTCCSGLCHHSAKETIATGSKQPESTKPLKALNLKRLREPVEIIPHTLTAVQQPLRNFDGNSAERKVPNDGRVSTAQERTYLCAGLIKTKEELLGHATTDDEEDDEISDMTLSVTSQRNPLKKPIWI